MLGVCLGVTKESRDSGIIAMGVGPLHPGSDDQSQWPECPIREALDQAISGHKEESCLPGFVYCLEARNILNCCV